MCYTGSAETVLNALYPRLYRLDEAKPEWGQENEGYMVMPDRLPCSAVSLSHDGVYLLACNEACVWRALLRSRIFVVVGKEISIELSNRLFGVSKIVNSVHAASLALAVPAMKRDEIRSVFVCLEEGEYVVFGYSLQIVVLKGVNPIAFLDELDVLHPSFATTPVCEESPDVECDIVISNEAVTLKESGAESGTTYAHGEIVALDRSKIYEM